MSGWVGDLAERDALWCRALISTCGPETIERVTHAFNAMRPEQIVKCPICAGRGFTVRQVPYPIATTCHGCSGSGQARQVPDDHAIHAREDPTAPSTGGQR